MAVAYLWAIVAVSAGLLLIVAGVRKSPWVIPTERNLFHHPLTFIGLFVPERWLWVASILIGMVWIGVGLFFLFQLPR
jgi:hypothetical protein